MQHRYRSRQTGFTLVEIAIVLVIIGLLLKGQEMIENAKIKSIVNDMKAVQAAYNGYIDRYKSIPGDETNATMNARGWNTSAAAGGGNANGVLTVTAATAFGNGGEERAFWRALRASGLIAGAPAGAAGSTQRWRADGCCIRCGGGGRIWARRRCCLRSWSFNEASRRY